MATMAEKITEYTPILEGLVGAGNVDEQLLEDLVRKYLPALQNADSEHIAASDPDEVTTFKNGMKDMGIPESEIDDRFDSAVAQYGNSNPRKKRVVLYYLIQVKSS